MSNTLTNEIFVALRPSGSYFAPAIMIDRTVYPWINNETPYITTNGFDSIAERVSHRPPIVAVNIQGTYNSANRTINATITAKFEQTVLSADYRITLMLVEDSIVGTGSNYDQKCYDSNWANQHYPGMYNPTTQCIEGYPHRFVLRDALLGTWGASGIIPNTPLIGTVYSTNANFVVPAGYNSSRLYLVAFVARYSPNKNEKYILNSNNIKVSNSFITSIDEKPETFLPVINEIYPMPSSGGDVYLNYTLNQPGDIQINILNLLGEKIKLLQTVKNCNEGFHELVFNTLGLTKGIYFISLQSEKNCIVQKLIIN